MDELFKVPENASIEDRIKLAAIAAELQKTKLEVEKTKLAQEVEKTKQKQNDVIIEQEKTKQMYHQLKRRKIDEDSEELSSMLNAAKFYNICVLNKVREFNIEDLLKDNNKVNDDMVKIFENYLGNLKLNENTKEDVIQDALDHLIKELFKFDDFTSLKYLNTHRCKYLNETTFEDSEAKAPDCTFVYKNININITGGNRCLNDFVICLGELKKPSESIDAPKNAGQLCSYLTSMLKLQDRGKIYGFITNLCEIRFYYVTRTKKGSIVNEFYHSDTLKIFNTPLPSTSLSNKEMSNQQSEQSHLNKNTIKIFIKFLTMDSSFYEYDRLNINSFDNLFQDKYRIEMKLGTGATSIAYLLVDKDYDEKTVNPKLHVIKICKTADDEKHFKNEIDILNKLKTINSDNFDLFFSNIKQSSYEGKFIIFENFFERLRLITTIQAQQLISIVEYLYKCNILHRDIRPENLMVDKSGKNLKLIDFGFAVTFKNNENKKDLPIAGVVLCASLKFLEKYYQGILTGKFLHTYEYERNYDLHCALNVIMYLKYERIAERFKVLKDCDFILKVHTAYEFWRKEKQNNEIYNDLLCLIEKFSNLSDFELIKNHIKEWFSNDVHNNEND